MIHIMYDVVSAKDVVPPEEVDILDVVPGTVCRASYSGQYYKARIIECGIIIILYQVAISAI